jgi:hypothetical protein
MLESIKPSVLVNYGNATGQEILNISKIFRNYLYLWNSNWSWSQCNIILDLKSLTLRYVHSDNIYKNENQEKSELFSSRIVLVFSSIKPTEIVHHFLELTQTRGQVCLVIFQRKPTVEGLLMVTKFSYFLDPFLYFVLMVQSRKCTWNYIAIHIHGKLKL